METNSIEARAAEYAVGFASAEIIDAIKTGYIAGAKEERERCIEKAWEFFLHNMGNERNQVMTKFVDDDGEIVWAEVYEDDFYDMLRKAIEEGGEG